MKREFLNACEADSEEILKLYKTQLGREFCAWDEHYPSETEIEYDLKRDALFVLKEDGKIVATVSIDEDPNVIGLDFWSKDLQPGGELSRLGVLPECQNRGIAREMLSFGMEKLKERGFKSVHFLVNKYNVKALRSYEKLSFNMVGECFMYNQPYYCFEKEL